MAGFLKKVFSFGKKEVEERPAEDEPLAPINWAALEALRGDGAKAVEPPAAAVEPSAAETMPPIREPSPIVTAPIVEEIAPELETIPSVEAVAEPSADVGAVPHPPAGTFSPYSDGEKEEHAPPPPAPLREWSEDEGQSDAAQPPIAEFLPPIRERSPIVVDPILDEIAPELEAVPSVEAVTEPIADVGAAPHPPAGTFSPYGDGEKEEAAPPAPAVERPGRVTVAKSVAAKAEPVQPVAPQPRPTWFQRLREGLARSSRELSGSIAGVFTKKKLDEDTLQDLEDVLIRADLGVETALRVTDTLASTRLGRDVSDAEVRAVMASEIEKVLTPVALPLELDLSHKPHVILVVGVNGTGKTTTIGKLAAQLTDGGLSVMLAAGDTFRAAAIEQLKIWGERTRSPVVASKLGADAAGLAYDAFEKARQAGVDVLIIDTAGRLQNKAELMAELEKIVRVLGKLDPEAPHTVLQTVDATTGQNALNQVEIFRNVAGVNGLVMTKLDGTARGGILVAIAAKHKLPVYFIGVGEQVDDLEPFSAGDFAKAIAGVG